MQPDQKVTILLVDDKPSNLLALEAILESLGQNLVKARSGRDALRRLLGDDFALILMDVQMPDMDGLETAALIREREKTRHTPIIFLTAYERTDAQLFRGYSLGAVDYLTKPIVPEVLRAKATVLVDLIGRDITTRKRSERRLAAVRAVTRALACSVSLEEAAVPILQTVGETLRCDLGVLWQVDAAADVLRCAAVWHVPGSEVTEFERFSRQITFARDEGLPGRAWGTGEPAWVAEALFPCSVTARRNEPCGALAFPLRSDVNTLGVLEFFSPDLRQPDGDLFPLVTNLGSQIAQFIERREAERVVHARAEEFSLARKIQQGLLPKAPPALPGLEIAAASHPAQETGGDYFDFIPLSDGQWGIVIGDASGHGIGAALLIAETCAYLRALALTHTDPGSILRLVNGRLAEDIGADHFVTLFLAQLDPRTGSLAYSSAGHWPGYVLDAQGKVKLGLKRTSLPLGLYPDGDFSNGPAITLDPGDLVFLFSDGIVEAPSGAGPAFGIGRALEVVCTHRHEPPGEIIAALMHQVREWSGSAQADDMTAIVIKVGG